MWTPAFYVRILIMLSLLYVTFLNFNKVMSIETLGKFDPYEILEISTDSTMKEIKSRYRKLSLTKHPDKNPDDPLAVQEFIRLTKAYRILTDDTARENYRKYGNPDGPGSYSVGIALPRVLLQKENHIPVLLSAFFFLLVVIPGYIWYSVGDSLRLDENGIHTDNRKIIGAFMNENML